VEWPTDFGGSFIDAATPGLAFAAYRPKVWTPPIAQALLGEEPDSDFGRIEPTAMFGRVVDGETLPDEFVHHQVNPGGFRVRHGGFQHDLSKLKAGLVPCGEAEVPVCFGFHGKEGIAGRNRPSRRYAVAGLVVNGAI